MANSLFYYRFVGFTYPLSMILSLSRKMMNLSTITLRSHLVDNKYFNKEKNFQQFGIRVIDLFALFSLTSAETTSNTSLNLITSPS